MQNDKGIIISNSVQLRVVSRVRYGSDAMKGRKKPYI